MPRPASFQPTVRTNSPMAAGVRLFDAFATGVIQLSAQLREMRRQARAARVSYVQG